MGFVLYRGRKLGDLLYTDEEYVLRKGEVCELKSMYRGSGAGRFVVDRSRARGRFMVCIAVFLKLCSVKATF